MKLIGPCICPHFNCILLMLNVLFFFSSAISWTSLNSSSLAPFNTVSKPYCRLLLPLFYSFSSWFVNSVINHKRHMIQLRKTKKFPALLFVIPTKVCMDSKLDVIECHVTDKLFYLTSRSNDIG